MSYKKTLERLEALPRKELVAARYFWGPACCAIGALLPRGLETVLDENFLGGERVWALYSGCPEVREAFAELGLTQEEAADLQDENDRLEYEPATDRYQRVVRWLRERVALEGR